MPPDATAAPAAQQAAQPDQPAATNGNGSPGQGTSAETNPLYEQVLSAIPEALRGQVEPHLKEWDSSVTKKFQEQAEFRKRYEPYEELGIADVEPEQLKELLTLRELAQDEDSFNEWLLSEAEARGLVDPEGDGDLGGDDELGDGFDPADPDSLKSMLGELLDERLKPIEERFSSMDEQERIQEADRVIDTTLKELAAEHGEFDQEKVLRLSLAHAKDGTLGADAIKKGFADLQEIVSSAESGLFRQKEQQPATPERGGRPATATATPTSFSEASKQARELARQSS